jgi:hypothetical protein
MRTLLRARALSYSAVVALLATQGFAAQPRFTQMSPRGVQRGTEVEVVLTGTNLEDAEELLLYDQGLEILAFEHPEDEKQKGKQLKVKFKVAADCALGTQRMRIRTRTGISDLQNLHVGPLPLVAEKEPNTDFAQPQAIDRNVTVEGRIDREDVDYFVVEAKQGDRLTAEVFGTRLGTSSGGNYFDPFLAILDADRNELVARDDTTLVYNDSVAQIIAPKDGKYIIQLRDASYYGDSRAIYLLSVGDFPRPLATIPAGGKPGEKLTVTFVGDVKGPITREITLPETAPERFAIEVQDEHGIAPSSMPFQLAALDNVIEQEPNNDRTQGTAAKAPGAFNGVLSQEGDVDFFKFTAAKDKEYAVRVIARGVRTPLDAVTNVYRVEDGRRIEGNDDGRGGPDSYFRFKAPADGEYAVAIQDQLKRGGEAFAYRIEVSSEMPSIRSEPIEFSRYIQPNIEIPRGGGSGIVVTVRKSDFDGPINFRGEGLPAGVRIECPESWRGAGQMPIVFYADEDAPLAGGYYPVIAHLADPKQPDRKVEDAVTQDILMIRGQNNNRVWQERLSRLPIVVTEKLPFRVWVEQPKVPVVRGGPLNIVVKCEKDEGWDEEIQVRLLENPSGVSSSTSAKIPKGQTETILPINAAGNAAVQDTMIAVRCIARVGNGNVESCTPFVPLRIADQYLKFEFVQGAVPQGQEVDYAIKVTKQTDFEGEAEVKLMGLPTNATAEPLKVTKDSTELVFTIKAAENTPPGLSKNLFCQVLVPEAGDMVTHNLGSGVLRVDPPPPPKKNADGSQVAAKGKPAKPLSRLEQLRQQQKEKEAAEKSGGGGSGQ